jgi:hypothetical protein
MSKAHARRLEFSKNDCKLLMQWILSQPFFKQKIGCRLVELPNRQYLTACSILAAKMAPPQRFSPSAIEEVPLVLLQDNRAPGRCESNGWWNEQNALDIGQSSLLITYLRKACV